MAGKRKRDQKKRKNMKKGRKLKITANRTTTGRRIVDKGKLLHVITLAIVKVTLVGLHEY